MAQPQKDGDLAEHKGTKKALKEDNSTNNAPGRLLAQELGRGRTSTQKLIKETEFRPLKQVATSHKSKAKRAKRLQMEGELLAAYANVMRTTSIQWSDETWVGENTCARSSPRRDRKYYNRSGKKDSVLERLMKPADVRTPGR